MEIEQPSVSVLASTSSIQQSDEPNQEPQEKTRRSTRRSVSLSSTASSSSSSSNSNAKSTRNRSKLKKPEPEDENAPSSHVKFDLGSFSNESLESSSVSSDKDTQNIENNSKQTKTNKKTHPMSRKSLQLLNSAPQPASQDPLEENEILNGNNSTNKTKTPKIDRRKSIRRKSTLNLIDEEAPNENSENLNQTKALVSKTPTKSTKFKVNNLDENTLDGFSTNSSENSSKNEKNVKNLNEKLSNNNVEEEESTNTEVDVEGDSSSNTNTNQSNSLLKENLTNKSEEKNNKLEDKPDDSNIGESEAQVNKLDNDLLGSQSSFSNLTQEPKKKKRRRTSVMVDLDKNGCHMTLSKLFVYKWPIEEEEEEVSSKSKDEEDTDENINKNLNKILVSSTINDLYILQEQVSEYLGVKSFKRKYPDIYRRFIDIKEREYLKKNQVVTETQCDLGLTALKLSECFDLMADDYPDKYKEFNDYFNEKRRRAIAAAALQAASNSLSKRKSELFSTGAKPSNSKANMSESERMKELIKKAMKSVASYNSQMQKEKKEERQTFYDLQTMRVQKPCASLTTAQKSQSLFDNHKKGHYPVALLPGQYQYYYKNYNTDELKCLPVNTVIYPPPTPTPLLYTEWKKQQSKPNQPLNDPSTTTTTISKKLIEIKPVQKYESSDEEEEQMDYTPMKSAPESQKAINNSATSTIRITAAAAPTVAKLINSTNKTCYICQKSSTISTNSSTIDNNQLMISCSSCPRFSHPNCLELNPKLVDWTCIRTYEWQCMDCKKCSKCNNPHDEDKMMFCDRCDRGFHTYCVGMSQVPTGSWLCKPCSEFNDKLNAIQEKINIAKASQMNGFESTQSSQIASAISTTPTKLKLKLKSKLNSSLLTSDGTPVTTPLGEKRGRGRPPGSLNKPKDPNSPKKLIKTPKPGKLKESLLINNLNNSNQANSLSQHQYEDTFNESLNYENSYEQQPSYGYLQYNGNSTNQTTFYAGLDETSTNSQFNFS